MTWVLFLALAQAAAPTQIERGEVRFFDAAKGCGACHSLKGKGTAVGPDLKEMSRLPPRAIAMGVRSTVTQYVQVVKLKSGESFPTLPPTEGTAQVKIYDLSKMPPAEHQVERSDLGAMTPNATWKHPPSVKKYTDQQLADIIAYVRFAGANNRQPVDPADVR